MRRRLGSVALAFACALAVVTPSRAEQAPVVQPTTGPHSMFDLNTNYLNPALRSLLGNSSGAAAPANGPGGLPLAYQFWADISTSPPTLRIYDGAQWLPIGTIDPATHTWMISTQGFNSAFLFWMASLPTTLPASPGVAWSNGGLLSISQ